MVKLLSKLINSRAALNAVDLEGVLVEIDDSTRIKLQDTLFGMYKELLETCLQNDITPFLIGGSALGAVRHKGFIPWDDDIDIGMTRGDYNRFLSIFENELTERYVLNAPNYSNKVKARFTKIIKKGTVFKEITDNDDAEMNGIFLDIFIIENVPDNVIPRTLKGLLCNALQFISSQVYIAQNNNNLIRTVFSQESHLKHMELLQEESIISERYLMKPSFFPRNM